MATAIRFAGYGVTLLSLYYIGRIAAEAPLTLPHYSARNVATLAAVCAASAVFPFLAACTWKLSVELVSGRRMGLGEAFGVYVTSNIGKYLPGNVMQYVGRNYLGARQGWPHHQLALGSIVEIVSIVAIPFAILVAFHVAGLWTWPPALLRASERVPDATTLAVAAAIAATLAVALWSRLRGIAAAIAEVARRGKARAWAARAGAFVVKVTGISLAGLVGSTILIYALAATLPGAEFRSADFFNVACSWTIAGYAGILTPGVPGGIGVKESAAVILLSAYGYDPANLVMVSVLARVSSMVGDVIAFLIGVRLGRRPADG